MAVQGDWELPCSPQNVRGEQVIWRELSSRNISGFGRELTNPVGFSPPCRISVTVQDRYVSKSDVWKA